MCNSGKMASIWQTTVVYGSNFGGCMAQEMMATVSNYLHKCQYMQLFLVINQFVLAPLIANNYGGGQCNLIHELIAMVRLRSTTMKFVRIAIF
jgi:hypothetical protein